MNKPKMVFRKPSATFQRKTEDVGSKEFLPPQHRLQVGSFKFRFDLIYKSLHFKMLLAKSFTKDLIRDICDPSISSLTPAQLAELPLDRYLEIVQKSDTWFAARLLAAGTASVVGKNCNLPRVKYPTIEQCNQAWVDLENKKPFEKTHTMRGHMKWGVGYEDPALVHFTEHTGLGVVQVGTIHLPMDVVYRQADRLFDDFPSWTSTDDYLLVSPDGVVGIPEPTSVELGKPEGGRFRKLYNTVVGMLEIKCISPFHHIETNDGFLTWVNTLMRRQWTKRTDIPLVYIVQMSLQALAGAHRLGLGDSAGMWFLRWSPNHYTIYKFSFLRLFQLGCWVVRWYHSTYSRRIKLKTNCSSTLTDLEQLCRSKAQIYYDLLLAEADYSFTKLECYPEFDVYHDATRFFKFKVEESDQVEFGLGHAAPSTTDTKSPETESRTLKKGRFRGLKMSAAVNTNSKISKQNSVRQVFTRGRSVIASCGLNKHPKIRRQRGGFRGLKR